MDPLSLFSVEFKIRIPLVNENHTPFQPRNKMGRIRFMFEGTLLVGRGWARKESQGPHSVPLF